MPLYVVQARGADAASLEKARFVADKFSWPAFVLAQLWLLYHRLWLVLVVWIVAEVAFYVLIYPHVSVAATLAVDGLARLYLGFEAGRLRIAQDSRKATLTDIVSGSDRDEAEASFFGQHAPPVSTQAEDAA